MAGFYRVHGRTLSHKAVSVLVRELLELGGLSRRDDAAAGLLTILLIYGGEFRRPLDGVTWEFLPTRPMRGRRRPQKQDRVVQRVLRAGLIEYTQDQKGVALRIFDKLDRTLDALHRPEADEDTGELRSLERRVSDLEAEVARLRRHIEGEE